MTDPVFITWVLEESPQLDRDWKNWSADNNIRQEAIRQARMRILSLHQNTLPITDEHIAYKVSQSLEIAKRREQAALTSKSKVRWIQRGAMAASVMLLMTLSFFVHQHYNKQDIFSENQQRLAGEKTEQLIEISNQEQKVKYVQLPDGSSVVLQRHSRISYNKEFNKKCRIVVLSGEAFFEVTKNSERPFFVYANELVTKVLGTSFSIKADEADGKVLVAVKTGKVSVFSKNDKRADAYRRGKDLSALLLMPNQQAIFERNNLRLTRFSSAGSELLKIPIENQQFVYNATPVSEVFASLEKAYGIRIEFNKQTMSNCSITATLGDEPLENKLKWICAILEANYQISENQINITGNSCQ